MSLGSKAVESKPSMSLSIPPAPEPSPAYPKEFPMPKTGLDALLRPEDSILVLIDHQPYQFTNLNSHEPTMIVNNVIGLAKTAKVFNVPTILTTVKFSQRESCLRRLHFSGTKSYSPIPWRTRNTADASPALVTRCGRPGRTE